MISRMTVLRVLCAVACWIVGGCVRTSEPTSFVMVISGDAGPCTIDISVTGGTEHRTLPRCGGTIRP